MGMNYIGLQIPQNIFDLKIRRYVVMRINLAAQVIEDNQFKLLILRKLIQVALRPKSRPGYKRDIMSPLGQEFTGNKRIFLRTA